MEERSGIEKREREKGRFLERGLGESKQAGATGARGPRLCMVDRQRQVGRQRGEEVLISGSKSPDPRYGTTDQNQLKNKINIHTGVPSPLPLPLSLLPLHTPLLPPDPPLTFQPRLIHVS